MARRAIPTKSKPVECFSLDDSEKESHRRESSDTKEGNEIESEF